MRVQDIIGRMVAIRGKRVILDSDLAAAYGVPTKRLNEKVRRHPRRFPADFMFLLTQEEWDRLRKAAPGRRLYRRHLPYVFTEHGAFMAAGLLRSKRAIELSIHIVRTLFSGRKTFKPPSGVDWPWKAS